LLALARGLATSRSGDTLAIATADLSLVHRALILTGLPHETKVALALARGATLTPAGASESVSIGLALKEAIFASVCDTTCALCLVFLL